MKRDDWTVPYTGKQLLSASQEKAGFHASRKQWWTHKKDELIEKIKSDGINVTESVVDELGKLGYHTIANSGGGRPGPDIQIDSGLVSQVREAAQKVHEHEGKVSGYNAWVQMLDAHQNSTFQLDNDDWMYYFGK